MTEWHITPPEIMNEWTDELLNLMIRKHVERLNPDTKPLDPDQTLHHLRLLNAALGGTETIKRGD